LYAIMLWRALAQVGGSQGGNPGTQPTDGKIKAPTVVGRMWLAGLGFFTIAAASLAGASRQFLNHFNIPSAIASVAQ
jgi:hypothetical protein